MNVGSRREEAIAVLQKNWRNGFTVPCEGLYPFQWNWDSGFIAIGWAHVDIEKAKQELRSLISGQWKNGFIPQIIFHNESDTYYPGPEVHGAHLSKHAPEAIKTSGITQPPVLGFVLEAILDISNGSELGFVAETFDKVYAYHRYFYEYRDPNEEGLAYICHNWESGTDNTPVWDLIWENLDSPDDDLPRKDNTHIDASNRPSNREYQHYIHLLELFKKWEYDDTTITEKCPFLIQDPLFNAMLIKSNESLIRLGNLLGRSEQVRQLELWHAKAKESFNTKLFNEDLEAYVYYDLRDNRRIDQVTSSSFTPLFAGIPSNTMAKSMVHRYFKNGSFSGNENELLLCASFNPSNDKFDPKRYWRGPVWVNLNWIIHLGLQRYGYDQLAEKVRADTLYLLDKFGFYEYFDPRRKVVSTLTNGYGGYNFSWSAALYIDLIKSIE